MTDETKRALARRAVARPWWRWMPGMLACERGQEARIIKVYGDGTAEVVDVEGRSAWGLARTLPDFDDPATLGCLLALVREAWRDPNAQVTRVSENGVWSAWRFKGHTRGRVGTREVWRDGATEAEALVAALEAAGGAR